MKPLCAVEGCNRPADERKWCHGHYEFWRRTGTEPTEPFLDTPEKRFWAKVDKNGPIPEHRTDLGPCWIWTGAQAGRKEFGRYGRFYLDGRTWQSHHVSFVWAGGVVPEGHELDHLCRVHLCVRPSHLEAVTHYENLMRGESLQAKNARKTHCMNGHEFSPENTIQRSSGGRDCRSCRDERMSAGRPQYAATRRAKRLAEGPQIHRSYTPDQREEAIQLGIRTTVKQAAETLGIPLGTVNVWVWKYRRGEGRRAA